MSGASLTDGDFTIETTTGDEAALRASLGLAEEPTASEPDPETHEDEPTELAAAPTTDDEPVAEPEKPKKGTKPRDNLYARLSQETQRRKALEDRAKQLEQELASLRSPSPAPAAPPSPAPAPAKSGYPDHLKSWDAYVAANPDGTYEDFTDARVEWRIQQSVKPVDVQALTAQIRQQEDDRRTWEAHQQREHAAREKYADYDEAIAAGDTALKEAGLQFSPALSRAILTFDKSAEMVYWLGTHPTECLQLARDTQGLDVAAAPLIRQLLDARLGAGVRPGAAPTAVTSSAKPPIKPVGASPVAPSSEYSDDEPFDVHFERENARDRKRGRL